MGAAFSALFWLLQVGSASAQSLDAHGPTVVPLAPEGGPLTLPAPLRTRSGAFALGGVFEWVDDPLLLAIADEPGSLATDVLLDKLLGLNLSGRVTLHERVGVGLTYPLWAAAEVEGESVGPRTSDLLVHLPVGLLGTGQDTGVAVTAVPFFDIPVGSQNVFLGDGRPMLGASVVGGPRTETWEVLAEVGVWGIGTEATGTQDFGGVSGRVGLAAAVLLGPVTAVGEVRAERVLDDRLVSLGGVDVDAGTSAEWSIGIAGRFGRGGVFATGGAGLGQGIGAPAARLRVGAAYHHGTVEQVVTPAPDAVEGSLVWRVVDSAGRPIAGAAVKEAEVLLGATGPEGELVTVVPRWRRGVVVVAPGFADLAVETDSGDGTVDVALAWLPAKVPYRVVDQEGRRVNATVVAVPDGGGAAVPGSDGVLVLAPGKWWITISAEGMGAQARTVVLDQPGATLPTVEFVGRSVGGSSAMLTRLWDPEGRPVTDARILVDGLPIGTTTTGGNARLASLPPGIHRIEVEHDLFTPLRLDDAALWGPETAFDLVLSRIPGSVRVRVRGSDGMPAPDATLRFDGASRLPPVGVDSSGERVTVLSAGTWRLYVVSPTRGSQQREVVVTARSHRLMDVDVVLQGDEDGDASLDLSVVDLDGVPVGDVAVSMDGRPYGTTATGGTLRIDGLRPGLRTLDLALDGALPTPANEALIDVGLNQVVATMRWAPGSLWLDVLGPNGPVGDATVRLIGPTRLDPVELGPTGSKLLQPGPGRWTVAVISPTAGFQQRVVDLPASAQRLERMQITLGAEGGLASLELRLVDPEGAPVADAEVQLGGASVGVTGSLGGLSLRDVDVGRRELFADAPLLAPLTTSLRLVEGKQAHELEMAWAAGLVDITVRGASGLATDAVVRALGPRALAPSPVDASGQRRLELGPGRWQVVAISPTQGVGQQVVELSDGSAPPQAVALQLARAEEGDAMVVFRVFDDLRTPVPGAEVSVDGVEIGETGDGGVLMAPSLEPGRRDVQVSAPGYARVDLPDANLVAGEQERLLELVAQPSPVELTIVDVEGRPVAARVSWVGPSDVADVVAGADGRVTTMLRPGRWTAIAAADGLGPARVDVTVGGERAQARVALEPARVSLSGGSVDIREEIRFGFGAADLRPEADGVLGQVAAVLLAHPEIARLVVEGHADNVGDLAYNHALSQRRAEAVRDALIARGVARERLVARGYGTQRPVAGNDDEAGRAANRRVAFTIAETAER